jgi:hypothetical protein
MFTDRWGPEFADEVDAECDDGQTLVEFLS